MKFYKRRFIVALHDSAMIMLAWVVAFLTRFNADLQTIDWVSVQNSLPMVFVIQAAALWFLGCYRGLWRFASLPDLWNIVRASLIGILGITLALALMNRLEGVPRTVLIFYPLWLVFFLSASRLGYRIWKEHGLTLNSFSDRKRVIILGAGRAGEMLVRDMRRDSEFEAIAFLDDQADLTGARVHGVPVLGKLVDLADVVTREEIGVVVIAMPSISREQMQRVVRLCEKLTIPFRTVPRIDDLVSGQFGISELREVSIEDLLGRDPVSLDWSKITTVLKGKTVLISGAGGSIGSELCRQVGRLEPETLVLFENSEYALYKIERELNALYPDLTVCACLGDVRDSMALEHVFARYSPSVVFHAAAYKHVPMLEEQARQAAYNNIIGTSQIARAADKHGVGTFVMVSTDKAVNPANIMGATKRVAEIFCQGLNEQSKTHFITVRFGNVLDSAGSVVPLFREQIAKGGPVTVTHPDITRYFMTIPEASQLILQAGSMGKGGEIFVLEMGAPIKIRDLADQMIRLAGKIPGEEIEIAYSGLRPGEKLYEELFYDQESLIATRHEKICLANCRKPDWDVFSSRIDSLKEMCDRYDEQGVKDMISLLVPEMVNGVEQQEPATEAGNIIQFEKVTS